MEPTSLVRQPASRIPGAIASGNVLSTASQAAPSAADRGVALRMLNEALSIEVMCAQRCQRQAFVARDLNATAFAEGLERHAAQAQSSVERLLARIAQLGGESPASAECLAHRSQSEYVGGVTLSDMLNEDLVAERMAVAGYRQMIDYLGEKDPVTRGLLEDIMAMEAAHVHDLADLLDAQ